MTKSANSSGTCGTSTELLNGGGSFGEVAGETGHSVHNEGNPTDLAHWNVHAQPPFMGFVVVVSFSWWSHY